MAKLANCEQLTFDFCFGGESVKNDNQPKNTIIKKEEVKEDISTNSEKIIEMTIEKEENVKEQVQTQEVKPVTEVQSITEEKSVVKTQKKEKQEKKEKKIVKTAPDWMTQLTKLDNTEVSKFFEISKFKQFVNKAWNRNNPIFDVTSKNTIKYNCESCITESFRLYYESANDKELTATMLYVDESLTTWIQDVKFKLNDNLTRNWSNYHHAADWTQPTILEFKVGKPRVTSRLYVNPSMTQELHTIKKIVEKNNPYVMDFIDEQCDLLVYVQVPHIETLYKAGFKFVKHFLSFSYLDKGQVEKFNRLCQAGTKPKDIFKTSKTVYTVLKEEKDLSLWDTYRKLDKFGRIKTDTIQQVYDQGFTEKDLNSMNSILAKEYDGKKVFSWDSLLNYLVRVDTFEAIGKEEAFMLLSDYLNMCNQLEREPKIDGDSLKREHDVTARTVRQKRDEIMAKKMQKACDENQQYNYSEAVYSIRSIKNYDDLIDEASQQHNCVASYGDRISRKQSLIFVMRETAKPEKSLITVELSEDGKTIRQKFMAYNRPIHNKSQSEFLERWLKHIKKIQLATA